MDNQSTRYEILIGKKQDGELQKSLISGHAFLMEGDSHYTVKLMMFPGQTYYLTKNRDSHDRYTVFSKLVQYDQESRFQNPVGSGRLSSELGSYLEIYFPVLKSQMFMCLYPKDY